MRSIIREEILQSDNVAIMDDKNHKITYRELGKKACDLAQHVEKRSLVFILCDHGIETVEFIYSILHLNRIPLLLSDDIDEGLLGNLITVYKPQYIYCRNTNEICSRYPYEIKMEDHILLKTEMGKYPIHPDVALLLSTSGTTGSPKLVKLTYDNLYNSAEQVCSFMDIHRGQKGISPLSMSYVYGFTFCLWHWYCGATLLTTEESILSNSFHEFYKRERANNFAATPHIYRMLHRIRFWDQEKFGYLHWAMSAGSQLTEKDHMVLVSLLKDKFWNMYGQTECTCFISAMNFEESNIKFGSVGKMLKSIDAEIDKKTNELILKGKSVCMGYATDKEQLAEEDKNNGILHTGDGAYMDDEGYIYLKGRLTREIKILGKRVSLDDIDSILVNKFPDIEFSCIGKEDHIDIFCSGVENGIDKEILLLLDRSIKIPKNLISVVYLEKIPRNSAGKVMYARLAELVNERKNIEVM